MYGRRASVPWVYTQGNTVIPRNAASELDILCEIAQVVDHDKHLLRTGSIVSHLGRVRRQDADPDIYLPGRGIALRGSGFDQQDQEYRHDWAKNPVS
jgi:hypothetical protein